MKTEVKNHTIDPSQIFSGMTPENQFFWVLNKVSHNATDKDLAEEFGVTDGTVYRLFHVWNQRMYRQFKILKIYFHH